MPRLWLVNQFANTPDLPGHTRQYEVASGLVQAGWDVAVFASDFNLTQRRYRRLSGLQLWASEQPAGIRWTWLWVSPYRRNNWRRQLNMLSFCAHVMLHLLPLGVWCRLRGKGPDVLVASSPQLPAAWTCLWISRLLGIPYVAEIRDLWPQVLIDQGGKRSDSPMVRLLGAMERQVYAGAHSVVVLAKGAQAYVGERGARRCAWLPNGPDLVQFGAQPLPADDGIFAVLYAGAHGEANGLEHVIEAARQLECSHPGAFCFQLIGDGPEKPQLIRQAAGLVSVVFEPPIPKQQMPARMVAADAVLLSLKDVPLFRYGVSPNKLYDAYALGRPVITTVPGAINTEVEQHQLGVTAPPGDPQALAAVVAALAALPRSQREAMGRRARQLAEGVYGRQRVIARYDALLREVLG
jgi:glycosyltransferase involved in cell wall biosynthesis